MAFSCFPLSSLGLLRQPWVCNPTLSVHLPHFPISMAYCSYYWLPHATSVPTHRQLIVWKGHLIRPNWQHDDLEQLSATTWPWPCTCTFPTPRSYFVFRFWISSPKVKHLNCKIQFSSLGFFLLCVIHSCDFGGHFVVCYWQLSTNVICLNWVWIFVRLFYLYRYVYLMSSVSLDSVHTCVLYLNIWDT